MPFGRYFEIPIQGRMCIFIFSSAVYEGDCFPLALPKIYHQTLENPIGFEIQLFDHCALEKNLEHLI